MLIPSDHDDQIPQNLLNVELVYFTSSPATIGPFGTSVLRWKVKVNVLGVTIKLGGTVVPKEGEKVVQPISTTIYRLSANNISGTFHQELGTTAVTVSTEACQWIHPLATPTPELELEGRLNNAIRDDDEIDFRTVHLDGQLQFPKSIVTFSPGRIHFTLNLVKVINNSPNAYVDIDASFGLRVIDDEIFAFDEIVHVKVWVDNYVWLLVPPARLLARLEQGRHEAEQRGHETIQGLVSFINFVWDTHRNDLPGMKLRTILIEDKPGGRVGLSVCPDHLLIRYAEISELPTTPHQ